MKKILIIMLFVILILNLSIASSENNVYIASGEINGSSFNLDSFYYLGNYNETTQPNATNYSMEFYDVNENLLKNFNFPVFSLLENNETKIFNFDVDFPENTKYLIFKESSQILREFSMSSNIPTLNFLFVNCSLDTCQAMWDANNTDGKNLTFDIYYTNDDVNWNIISLNWKPNYISFSTKFMPEGSYKLKIRASDGFNFAEAESDYFYVEEKEPYASILGIVNGSVFVDGTEIYAEGFGYDSEDGCLIENSSLTWKLDKDIVGYGEWLLLSNLSIGNYVLELEARDSDNNLANETIQFSIDNKTKPDVSISKIFFSPESITILENSTIPSIYLSASLFNIRNQAYCNISLYDNNELFENNTILILANDYTDYETWWQPNSVGNHIIKVSITGCEPEEDNTENNKKTREFSVLLSVTDNNWCNGADTNKDTEVNALDYVSVSNNYGKSGCNDLNNNCDGADTNKDTEVNALDYVSVSNNLGRINCTGIIEESNLNLNMAANTNYYTGEAVKLTDSTTLKKSTNPIKKVTAPVTKLLNNVKEKIKQKKL